MAPTGLPHASSPIPSLAVQHGAPFEPPLSPGDEDWALHVPAAQVDAKDNNCPDSWCGCRGISCIRAALRLLQQISLSLVLSCGASHPIHHISARPSVPSTSMHRLRATMRAPSWSHCCRVRRDPRILRLTGRHPLNCEPTVPDLMVRNLGHKDAQDLRGGAMIYSSSLSPSFSVPKFEEGHQDSTLPWAVRRK